MSRPLTRGSDGRVWVISFVVMSSLMGSWAIASPLFSSPDEPAHVVKAAGAARGQFLGNRIAGQPLLRTFRVPALFAASHAVPACYAFKADVSADCAADFSGSRRPGDVITHVGNYPPLYYVLVGLPSLISPSARGIYLMRLASIGLSAAFLAWALVCARRWRSPLLVAGVAVATTPMVLYFGASVNPNSLEMSSAICLWVAGLLLLAERPSRNPDDEEVDSDADGQRPGDGMLIAAAAVSAAVLVSLRALSPLLVGIIGIVLLGLTSRQRMRLLLRRRDLQVWLAATAVTSILAVLWLVVHDTIQIPRVPGWADLSRTMAARRSFGKSDFDIRQMIGVFGWLDTPSPSLTFYLWVFATGSLAVLGLVAATRRIFMALVVVVLATVLVPRLLEFPTVQKYGFGWQGRYGLPLAVGVPILAAFAIGCRPDLLGASAAKFTRTVVVLLGMGHVAAFAVALRRYMVGVDGPLNFLDGPWQPPVAPLVLLAGFSLAVVAWAWWLARIAVAGEVGSGTGR